MKNLITILSLLFSLVIHAQVTVTVPQDKSIPVLQKRIDSLVTAIKNIKTVKGDPGPQGIQGVPGKSADTNFIKKYIDQLFSKRDTVVIIHVDTIHIPPADTAHKKDTIPPNIPKSGNRDMEATVYSHNDVVYLRANKDTSEAIYCYWNGRQFEYGVRHNKKNYYFDAPNDLSLLIPNFGFLPTDYFTYGVSGATVYCKYNGMQFWSLTDPRFLDITNTLAFANGTIKYFPDADIFSHDNVINVLDYGFKSAYAKGTVKGNIVKLDRKADYKVGDIILIENDTTVHLGYSGIGGQYPDLLMKDTNEIFSYPDLPANTWVGDMSTGYLWMLYDGDHWVRGGDYTDIRYPNYYYTKIIPYSLRTRITNISENGLVLTLEKSAKINASNVDCWFDNSAILNNIFKAPGYLTDLEKPHTVVIPAGKYAVGEPIYFQNHYNWTINAKGSYLFSPRWITPCSFHFTYCDGLVINDLTYDGNVKGDCFAPVQSTSNVDELGRVVQQQEGILEHPNAYADGLSIRISDSVVVNNLTAYNLFQYSHQSYFSKHIHFNDCHYFGDSMMRYSAYAYHATDSKYVYFKNCYASSKTLRGNFEAFKSDSIYFLNDSCVHGYLAINDAGNVWIDGFYFQQDSGTLGNAWRSPYAPAIEIDGNILSQNPNSGDYTKLGVWINNVKMVQHGYIDDGKHTWDAVMPFIGANEAVGNITITNATYMDAPPYIGGNSSQYYGGTLINSTAPNTKVYNCITNNKLADYGNDNFYTVPFSNIGVADGLIINCKADIIKVRVGNVNNVKLDKNICRICQ